MLQDGFNQSQTRVSDKKNDHGLDFTIDKRDVVKLVKEAWAASFSRVLTNRKAILHRGWGPRALNFNILLHPDIYSSKPEEETETVQKVSGLKTDLDAGEINVTEGIAGTLIERIMLQREKEARTKGANVNKITAKCHATAKAQLTNHEKRCTAGLVASSGKFSLDQEVLGYARQAVEHQQEKQRNQELRRKDEHEKLSAQVQAIREKNLPPEQWTSGQLQVMLKWYKCKDDAAFPSKKADKLTRYYETCGRGDPAAPTVSENVAPLLPEIANDEMLPVIADDGSDCSVIRAISTEV
jgi:hypothetical protein